MKIRDSHRLASEFSKHRFSINDAYTVTNPESAISKFIQPRLQLPNGKRENNESNANQRHVENNLL